MNGPLQAVVLSADSLWSRHGFAEGDPYEFEDLGPGYDDETTPEYHQLYELMDRSMRDDLLELLVRRHLVPAIVAATGEEPTLSRIGTTHNPLRDRRFQTGSSPEGMPWAWVGIEIEVSPKQVMAAVGEIRVAHEARQEGAKQP